jgi:hypothetical protein
MKNPRLFLIPAICFVQMSLSQELPSFCTVPDTFHVATPPLTDLDVPLVAVYVDFSDSRKPDGTLPTVDADTSFFPGNLINSVAGMGWVRSNPSDTTSPFRKKIRKYVYEDYWNQLFSDSSYIDNDAVGYHPHPDWDTRSLRVYGSMRDYYREVSYGNLRVKPESTRSGVQDRFHTGIINRIDESNGKKFIRWIRLSRPKSFYFSHKFDMMDEAIDSIIARHVRGAGDPEYIEFDTTGYRGKYAVVGAGASIGGLAGAIPSEIYSVSEKFYYTENSDPRSWFEGITHHVHEFGHTIGLSHAARGSFDPMHWGGLIGEAHYRCPPHFNPMTKILAGWINATSIQNVRNNSTVSLRPSHLPLVPGQPSAALITIYGNAGFNDDYSHSEYFAVEYRTRAGFNRFSGGSELSPADPFSGGALVWLKIPGTYTTLGNITLKIPNYGPDYAEDQDPLDYLTPGRALDSVHSTPNSDSWENVGTGIRLSNTGADPTNLSLQVTYQLEAPPSYSIFMPSEDDTLWSGHVYVERSYVSSSAIPVRTIAAGTTIDLYGSSAGFVLSRARAVGNALSPIVFRGVGYGGNRTKYYTISAEARYEDAVPLLMYCRFQNGNYGLEFGSPWGNNAHVPSVSNCSFEDCDTDIRINGSWGPPLMDIAAIQNNSFSTLAIRFGTELSQTDMEISSGKRLVFEKYPAQFATSLLLRSNRVLTINGSLRLEPSTSVIFENGSKLRVSGIAELADTCFWTLPLTSDFYLLPGSSLKMGWGAKLISYGKFKAIGSLGNLITITSSKLNPAPGDWQMIDLKGGPDTLKNCVVSYSQNGIYFNNTSTNLLESSTVNYASGYAVQAFNCGLTQNSVLIKNCILENNLYGATVQNGRLDILQTTEDCGIRSNEFGVNVWTGGRLYMNNAYIYGNSDWGIYVNGSTASANLTPDGITAGQNRVRDNSDGQIWVQTGSALLGNTNTTCRCEDPEDPLDVIRPDQKEGGGGNLETNCVPPCYTVFLQYAGYNRVSGPYPWVRNSTGTTVPARLNYWGNPQQCPPSNPTLAFPGPGAVDIQFCQTGGAMKPLLAGHSESGDGSTEGFEDSTVVRDFLQGLKEELLSGSANGRRALHHLALLCGVGGKYPQFLQMNWRALLDLALVRNIPVNLKNLVRAYRLQDMMDKRQFEDAISYANSISNIQDDELWFHAQATKVFAFAAEGQLDAASATFQSMKTRATAVNPNGMAHLEFFLSQEGLGQGDVRERILPNAAEQTLTDTPLQSAIEGIFPNPFNPSTSIRYSVASPSLVTVKVFDVLGREVRKVVEEPQSTGVHLVSFDASQLSSGVYFCVLRVGVSISTAKMVVMK